MNRSRSNLLSFSLSLSLDYKRGRRRDTLVQMARRLRRRPVPRRRRRRRQPQKGGLLPLMALGLAAGLAYQKRKKKKTIKRARAPFLDPSTCCDVVRKENKQTGAGSKNGNHHATWMRSFGSRPDWHRIGKSKNYKRMGAVGARGHYRSPWQGVKPWEL